MEHFQNNDIRRIIAFLDEEIRSRGYGEIRQVDRAVGRKPGWWQNRVAAGSISGRDLLRVLDYLGLQPGKTIRRALGREDELELDRPRGKPPKLVIEAEQRFEQGREGLGVGLKWIETLDELRYSDPGKVIRMAELHVDEVELELLPRFLGVIGSAWRLLLMLDEADHAIQLGIRIAEAQEAPSIVGRLLQRLSYVVGDYGEFRQAFDLAEEARLRFMQASDETSVATTFVDQGVWLSRLGESRAAVASSRLALRLLPGSEPKNLSTAHQVLALNLQRLGRQAEALEHLSKAEHEAQRLGGWADGKLLWLRADILVGLGDLDQAHRLYEQVAGFYGERHYGETALATCDLVRVHLLVGENAKAILTARSMIRLLEPFRHNKIISAAIADLVRSGEEGLTLALVEHVKARIEGERTSPKRWRLLEVPRGN